MKISIDFLPVSGDAAIRMVTTETDDSEKIRSTKLKLSSTVLPHIFHNDYCKIPWVEYLQIAQYIQNLAKSSQVQVSFSEEADRRIRSWVREFRVASGDLHQLATVDNQSVEIELQSTEWNFESRNLTDAQKRDLATMRRLPNSANFSVPGAGKTTVALANHLLWAQDFDNPHLLIVAPKNAFPAWDEAIEVCLKGPNVLTRLVGGVQNIKSLLQLKPRYSIISYTQITNLEKEIRQLLIKNNVHVIVDESHRMKSGARGLAPSTLLRIAPYATRRDILSGTPAPQAPLDLEPQMRFMYPATTLSNKILTQGPKSAIGHLYVRTTQEELGLTPAIQSWVTSSMTEVQKVLYAVVADKTIQQLLAPNPRMRILKQSVMRLLQTAIDPIGASKSIIQNGTSDKHLLEICLDVIEEDVPKRLQDAMELASNVISQGRKVVLWAPFTHALETLAELASPFGSAIIYGGTSSGHEDEDGTRENIVKRFHLDDDLRVLVANPAAGGEGISLHRACQDSIFVGRTYNQAHYLQARDRTNRLGMPAGTIARETIIELVTPSGLGSVDLSVRRRLQLKIGNMASILNDADLRQLELDSDDQDQILDDGTDLDDIQDLILHLKNGSVSS